MTTSDRKSEAILKQLKYVGEGKLVWKFPDGSEKDANPKELSGRQFAKTITQGRAYSRPGRPSFLTETQRRARETSIVTKIIRQSMKDILSTNAFHDKNVDRLLHKMETEGNPEASEIDLVIQSAAALKYLGKKQVAFMTRILKELDIQNMSEKEQNEIKAGVQAEYEKLKQMYEKKKQEAKKNVDKRATGSPRAPEGGAGR